MEIQKSGIELNLRIQNFLKKISDLYLGLKYMKINKLHSEISLWEDLEARIFSMKEHIFVDFPPLCGIFLLRDEA